MSFNGNATDYLRNTNMLSRTLQFKEQAKSPETNPLNSFAPYVFLFASKARTVGISRFRSKVKT